MEQKEIPHMPVDSIQPDAQQKQEYQQYVKSVTPTHNLWTQMGKAFLTGGIICCIGQGILNYTGNVLGMDPQTSGRSALPRTTFIKAFASQMAPSPGDGLFMSELMYKSAYIT